MRQYGRWLLVAAVLTLFYTIGVATNVAPWLRGPEEWRWPYALPGTLARAWLPALLLASYVLFLYRKGPEEGAPASRRQVALLLVLAGLATPLFQLALLYVSHPDFGFSQLFYRTTSELAGGFFNVGVPVTDIRGFLASFPGQMPSYPVHPQRHPPGLPLLFALARASFDRLPSVADATAMALRPAQCHNLALMNLPNAALAAATIQMAVPFLLGFVVLPLYSFGRQIYGQAAGLRAALLWPLVPSIALWASRWNQVYALFAVVAFLLVERALALKRLPAFALAGLVVGVSTFFSFGNAVIILMVGLYALVRWWTLADRPSFRQLVVGGILFAAALVAPWVLAWLAYRVNFFEIWTTAMGTHLSLGRSYLVWLFYHPYDFFIFLGIVVAAFWFGQTGRAFIKARHSPDALALSFALGLVIVVVSGTSQGEVARVWAFLMPLALLVSVPRLQVGEERGAVSLRPVLAAVAALLAAQIFVSNLFLRPVSTGLLDPPLPPPAVAVNDEPLGRWQEGPILFRATLEVDGVDSSGLPVELVWGTSTRLSRPYTVFVHLLDDDGMLVSQADKLPLDGQWLTTCWQPQAAFVDNYWLPLPDDLPPGSYTVRAGLYWLPTGERALLDTGAEQTADSLEIGRLVVP